MTNDDGELIPSEHPVTDNGFSETQASELRQWLKRAVNVSMTFVTHQVIGIIGAQFAARLLLSIAADFIGLGGLRISSPDISGILFGNPYYLALSGTALVIGWMAGRRFRHRSMLFIWVLPFLSLCLALFANSAFFPASKSVLVHARYPLFSHFFGWDCLLIDRCYDQVIFTLPFYTSASYSIGALLAARSPENSKLAQKFYFSLVLAIGLFLLVGSAIEIVDTLRYWQQTQRWRLGFRKDFQLEGFLAIVSLGAIGAYLVRSAYLMRHELSSDNGESDVATPIDVGP